LNPKLSNLVDRIRGQFPHLDIRTDQTDIVRVIAKRERFLIGIEEHAGEYIAQFIDLDGPTDFESVLLKEVSSRNVHDFEEAVLTSISNVRPVQNP